MGLMQIIEKLGLFLDTSTPCVDSQINKYPQDKKFRNELNLQISREKYFQTHFPKTREEMREYDLLKQSDLKRVGGYQSY